MESVLVDLPFCTAWDNVLYCYAYLSSVYCFFENAVAPYVCDSRCGLTVKAGSKGNCFPILYAKAIIIWASEHKQKIRLKSVDNQVAFEFVIPD